MQQTWPPCLFPAHNELFESISLRSIEVFNRELIRSLHFLWIYYYDVAVKWKWQISAVILWYEPRTLIQNRRATACFLETPNQQNFQTKLCVSRNRFFGSRPENIEGCPSLILKCAATVIFGFSLENFWASYEVTTDPGVKSTLRWSTCLIERNGREKDVIAGIGTQITNIQCYEIVTNESTLQITHLGTSIYLSPESGSGLFFKSLAWDTRFAESNLFWTFFFAARAAEDKR